MHCVEIVWAEIYWGRLFLGPNLVSFNRAVVPYEISKVNFRVETKILVSMSEEIWPVGIFKCDSRKEKYLGSVTI
jgi:hypothetical protein